MKKREKKFETLEDIEQKLGQSSGRKKETNRTEKKTAFPAGISMEMLLREYGRLLVIPAVSLCLMLLIVILEAAFGGAAGKAAETAAESAVLKELPSAETTDADTSSGEETLETSSEAPQDPNRLRRNEDPSIDRVIAEYFTARLSADTDVLFRLFGRNGETGKPELEKKLKAQASWIQSYDGITVYTMPGMEENSWVCVIRYMINFRRTDTDAPGIMYCYLTKNEDGSFTIGENLRSDKVQYINEKLQDPDVLAMQEEADALLRKAVESDSTLALIYTSFMNGEIYNEIAPEANAEQEVDLFLNPEDSDLVGDMVFESTESEIAVLSEETGTSETSPEASSEQPESEAPELSSPETAGGAAPDPAAESAQGGGADVIVIEG